jgi:hypothetical protein
MVAIGEPGARLGDQPEAAAVVLPKGGQGLSDLEALAEG